MGARRRSALRRQWLARRLAGSAHPPRRNRRHRRARRSSVLSGVEMPALKIQRIVSLALACSIGFLNVSAQRKRIVAVEQTEFSAEDTAVKRPVPIPLAVMAILRTDSRVIHE